MPTTYYTSDEYEQTRNALIGEIERLKGVLRDIAIIATCANSDDSELADVEFTKIWDLARREYE